MSSQNCASLGTPWASILWGMCARFGLSVPKEDLERFLGIELPFEIPPAYNIAPTENAIAMISADGIRSAKLLRWGLVPAWADSLSIGTRMINARSETVMEKGAFKSAFEKRRCIVPASGFFEWTEEFPQADLFGETPKGKPVKQPLFIHPTSGGLMGMAGLWERWKGREGQYPVETFTILTTTPNRIVEPIHDRMPVILHPEDFDLWLSDERPERLLPLLSPIEDQAIAMFRVTPRMNNPRYKDADSMQAIA